MQNKVKIVIKNENANNIIKVLVRYNIYYKNLKEEKENVTIDIDEESLEKLYVLFSNVEVIKYYGIKRLIKFLEREKIFLISLLIGFIAIKLLSNIIFDIEIITNNTNLRERLIEELKKEDIYKYKFIKSYKKIENIKNKILENNKDSIEWLEIERIGTKYIVNITERVIVDKSKDMRFTDIVAK